MVEILIGSQECQVIVAGGRGDPKIVFTHVTGGEVMIADFGFSLAKSVNVAVFRDNFRIANIDLKSEIERFLNQFLLTPTDSVFLNVRVNFTERRHENIDFVAAAEKGIIAFDALYQFVLSAICNDDIGVE